jgi:hypothetical protein
LGIGLRDIPQPKLHTSLSQRCGYRQYNTLAEPLDSRTLRQNRNLAFVRIALDDQAGFFV